MRIQSTLVAYGALVLAVVGAAPAAGADSGGTRVGPAAYGDWRTDAPGVRRKLTPADMPAPLSTPPAANMSTEVARPRGALPKVPPGFVVDLFAEGLSEPRVVRVAPDGDIFVVESGAGRVRVYRDADASSPAGKSEIFASDLDRPYGLAFYPPGPDPRFVYVATPSEVFRYPYRNGDGKASGAPQVVVKSLPAGGHWTRDIAFSPDGETMWVSVGSGSNDAESMARLSGPGLAAVEAARPAGAAWGSEADRADVLAFDPEGDAMRIFATGIRNCSGMTIQPETSALWCVVNERDQLGDDLPPDYATRVGEGQFYGWPWYYIGDHRDPRHARERADLASRITIPDVLIQPHSAPLGIAFYEAGQFPPDYRGDAFVTLHGSWNRANRTGYKVVRLIFKNGRPTGEYEDFLVGFVADDAEVWGRPVGVAVTRGGALLVTDDAGDAVWRVRYEGR